MAFGLDDLLGGVAMAGVSTLGNMALQDRAFAQNRDLWREQKEAASAESRMKDFSKAGLNPHLIYGSGVVAPPSPTSTAKAAEMGKLSQYAEIKNISAETERKEVENALTRAQARLVQSQKEEVDSKKAGQDIDNLIKANMRIMSDKATQAGVNVTDNPLIRIPIESANSLMNNLGDGLGKISELWNKGIGEIKNFDKAFNRRADKELKGAK